MKKINVSITKAQIISFSVSLSSGEPTVSATIGLFTNGGKGIAEYSISTSHWEDEKKFELPMDMHAPILEIMAQLEAVVVRHMNKNQKALEA